MKMSADDASPRLFHQTSGPRVKVLQPSDTLVVARLDQFQSDQCRIWLRQFMSSRSGASQFTSLAEMDRSTTWAAAQLVLHVSASLADFDDEKIITTNVRPSQLGTRRRGEASSGRRAERCRLLGSVLPEKC